MSLCRIDALLDFCYPGSRVQRPLHKVVCEVLDAELQLSIVEHMLPSSCWLDIC